MPVIVGISVTLLSIIFILRICFTIIKVDGHSMSPTLEPGDRLFSLNIFPRRWLRKGRIVTAHADRLPVPEVLSFEFPESLAQELGLEAWEVAEEHEISLTEGHSKVIKRVTGLPGDTVRVPLSSLHALSQAILKSRCDGNGDLVWHVPEGHCFIRGDGVLSTDSLTYGPIPFSAIATVALFRLPSHPVETPLETPQAEMSQVETSHVDPAHPLHQSLNEV